VIRQTGARCSGRETCDVVEQIALGDSSRRRPDIDVERMRWRQFDRFTQTMTSAWIIQTTLISTLLLLVTAASLEVSN